MIPDTKEYWIRREHEAKQHIEHLRREGFLDVPTIEYITIDSETIDKMRSLLNDSK